MKLRSWLTVMSMLACAVIFTSCKKNNAAGRYIPAGAQAVLHINLSSLSSKLPWNEIKTNPLFKEANNTDSPWIQNIIDSPAVSGIDADKGIVFFIQKENNGGYIAIEGSIKDEDSFKAFCSRITSNANFTESEGIHYISRFPTCISWSNDRFVFITDAPGLQKMDDLHRRMKNDSIDITDHTPRDLKATCKNIFELEEKKSLAADEKFDAVMKEQGDLHVWINTEDIYKDLKLPGMLGLLNLENFYKGSVVTAVASFVDGSIKINAHSYSNKELAKIFEKFSGGKLSEDMLKRIPGKEVAAALAINFKPEALMEIAKLLNLDGIANSAAATVGFNADDFIKAGKGDIVFGLSDFTMKSDSITAGEINIPFAVTRPVFNTVFGAAVADKNAFDKLIAAGKKVNPSFFTIDEMPLAHSYNGTYFALANSQVNADAFVNAQGNNGAFINKIAGSPVGGYCNLQSLIKAFENEAAKDSSAATMYAASLKLWDNIVLKGGEFANGALNFTIEINMLDKSTNSLKQLNRYGVLVGDIMNRERKKEQEDMRAMEDALSPADELKGK